jgi:hypothetical protein
MMKGRADVEEAIHAYLVANKDIILAGVFAYENLSLEDRQRTYDTHAGLDSHWVRRNTSGRDIVEAAVGTANAAYWRVAKRLKLTNRPWQPPPLDASPYENLHRALCYAAYWVDTGGAGATLSPISLPLE